MHINLICVEFEKNLKYKRCFADVVVHTNGYASYTQKLLSSKTNHFQFQFRTKDHTGLLMHATGGSDFMTLELIKGKLRCAVLNASLSCFKTSFLHFQFSAIAMPKILTFLLGAVYLEASQPGFHMEGLKQPGKQGWPLLQDMNEIVYTKHFTLL